MAGGIRGAKIQNHPLKIGVRNIRGGGNYAIKYGIHLLKHRPSKQSLHAISSDRNSAHIPHSYHTRYTPHTHYPP